MNDINNVILCGRLTRDAELKHTQGGSPFLKFAIAVNRSIKNGDTWTERANFFDATLWGKRAEALAPYLHKGKQVCLQGDLVQNTWEQEGQRRSKVEINARQLQLLGGKNDSGQSRAQTEPDDEISFV